MSELFQKYGITLTEKQKELFDTFLALFLEKNKHINLSAIRDENGVIEKHFIDSVMLSKFMNLEWKKMADVGTGGGFPWVPLKIFFWDTLEVTFIDSVGKKVKAVEEFRDTLKLKNCHFVHGRGEELWKKLYKEKFDIITTRAVAYLPELIGFTFPMLKKGWILICYKLDNPEEIEEWRKSLQKFGAVIEKVEKYELADQKRSLIFIRK